MCGNQKILVKKIGNMGGRLVDLTPEKKWGYLAQLLYGYREGALESTVSRVGNPTMDCGWVEKGESDSPQGGSQAKERKVEKAEPGGAQVSDQPGGTSRRLFLRRRSR